MNIVLLSFSNDFFDKQAAFSSKMSLRREKYKISLPSHEYSQQLLHRSLSDQLSSSKLPLFKHLRKSCNFVKPSVLERNINDRLQVSVFLLPTMTNNIYDCWFKYVSKYLCFFFFQFLIFEMMF